MGCAWWCGGSWGVVGLEGSGWFGEVLVLDGTEVWGSNESRHGCLDWWMVECRVMFFVSMEINRLFCISVICFCEIHGAMSRFSTWSKKDCGVFSMA